MIEGSASGSATHPVYVSIDIDVLDPASRRHRHAGGGRYDQPRAAGDAARIRGCPLVGADVVEVSPAYDHAEVTAVAAANLAYEYLSLFARAAR